MIPKVVRPSHPNAEFRGHKNRVRSNFVEIGALITKARPVGLPIRTVQMTYGTSTAGRLPRLLTFLLVTAVVFGIWSSGALAAGIVPPANPAADCDHSADTNSVWDVSSIDACRAREGIGPVVLPSNWSSLTPTQQTFVLINLERVNRGLAPIAGLSASLDTLAANGAVNQTDPPFPSTGEGGGIWAGGGSAFGADMMWLYDDGANGFDANEDCATDPKYCWGHRDIILGSDGGGALVAGGGFSGSGGFGSFAYLIMSHYATSDLIFSWNRELRYFTATPQAEPLGSAASDAEQSAAAKQLSVTLSKPRRHHRHRKTTITVKFI